MAVGDRLTGEAIAKTGNSGSAKGLAFFDLEKMADVVKLGTGIPKSVIYKRHRSSVLQGNLPHYTTSQEGGNLGEVIDIDLATQINIHGGCDFDIVNGEIEFNSQITPSNPHVTFTSSDSLAFINVYWLKY